MRSVMRKSLRWRGQGRGLYCCKLFWRAPAAFVDTPEKCIWRDHPAVETLKHFRLSPTWLPGYVSVISGMPEMFRNLQEEDEWVHWKAVHQCNDELYVAQIVLYIVLLVGSAKSQEAKLCPLALKPGGALSCHIGDLSLSAFAAYPVHYYYS